MKNKKLITAFWFAVYLLGSIMATIYDFPQVDSKVFSI